MTTLAYFPNSSAQNSKQPLQALLDGARANGLTPVENNMHADCAVIWSVLWHGRMRANKEIYEHYRQQGRPVICMDVGTLHRGITWKVALDNITAQGYYGHTNNLDWDRPAKLNLTLHKNTVSNDRILIAAQHRNSLQVSNLVSMEQWVTDTVQQVKQHTHRPIVIRSHPRSQLDLFSLPQGITVEIPELILGTYDDFDIKYNYHTVINYNSGPGIQAAIHGIPVLVDQSSLAHPVSINIDQIDNPDEKDRDQWFVEICHTEYTVEELRNGLWLKRLRDRLLKA